VFPRAESASIHDQVDAPSFDAGVPGGTMRKVAPMVKGVYM
jgi:hypothetical protein